MDADKIDKQERQKAAENDERDNRQSGHSGEKTYREVLKSSDYFFHDYNKLFVYISRAQRIA